MHNGPYVYVQIGTIANVVSMHPRALALARLVLLLPAMLMLSLYSCCVRKLTGETVGERGNKEEPYLRQSRAVPTTHNPPTVGKHMNK